LNTTTTLTPRENKTKEQNKANRFKCFHFSLEATSTLPLSSQQPQPQPQQQQQ
jgi:hypothetical protein